MQDMTNRVLSIALTTLIVFVSGCSMNESKTKVSSSLAELQKIVDISLSPHSIRWEIFGTPEHRGGVPGPTDFVTLVAEVAPIDEHWFDRLPNEEGGEFIVPGAARPWMSSSFQHFLRKKQNAELLLPHARTCRLYRSRLKATLAPVEGFLCHDSGKALIYLTLHAAR